MARQSLQIELAERPKGSIVPGQTFRQRTVAAPTEADLKDGQLLLESLYLSLDPAMRGWLNDRRSYVPPVGIGEVMRGNAISRVIASKSAKARAGDIVVATIGFREVAILPETLVEPPFPLPPNGKLTDLLGVLGPTGLTAYFGMTRIGQPKPGDSVVVSAAAGATGSVAAQIAKISGARVVGTVGSDEKVRWLKEELGLDEALNYKDPDFKTKFKEATPGYIDVFFDNVGGEQLDMALGRAKKNARFVMCGGISGYNAESPYGLKNISSIIAQRIRMEGFIVFDYIPEYPAARQQLAQWLGEGKIQRKGTVVPGGLAVAEGALSRLFQGANTGKLLVEVKSPDEVSKL
ncbi:hypothetical protein B0T26DRAFT_715842 [Lasiosphaeria miniovina]|uniref:Dehydrogenase FUB6 n=1 Tax=Lasiosphaeria miniovina TaxID=1954250 RepID=A0AA40DRL0_9PEZI|nr:uncharacterized protein B0T26DRAFT_715842 [Lasiosphaeria miniovina]KAK0712985.1 hypothetical protein B0T26DRAFT_715842 [Lasiosphaeria miniovina]